MMFKRKVSLFHLVDDSLGAVEKANGSLNGGNMMPSIDKWYKKPYFRDSMRFCRRRRLFLYGIKKRSSQADEYPITYHAVSITGYCQQVTPIISPSYLYLFSTLLSSVSIVAGLHTRVLGFVLFFSYFVYFNFLLIFYF